MEDTPWVDMPMPVWILRLSKLQQRVIIIITLSVVRPTWPLEDLHNEPSELSSCSSSSPKLTDRAMYAYSASPDDPNEVSFAKGDMLDVIDGTGKWFQVRAPNGQTGVGPSFQRRNIR